MAFGPNHFTRDWDFLEGIAQEWGEIRQTHKLGSKATAEQIDRAWNAIFKDNPGSWPNLERLFTCLMTWRTFKVRLQTIYWAYFAFLNDRGRTDADCVHQILVRKFFTIARNAHKWLRRRDVDPHWAFFWNERNLIEEFTRMLEVEMPNAKERQLPEQPGEENEAPTPMDSATDYRGRTADDPQAIVEALEERCRGLTPEQRAAIFDWYHNAEEFTAKEDTRIANKHNMDLATFRALLARVLRLPNWKERS